MIIKNLKRAYSICFISICICLLGLIPCQANSSYGENPKCINRLLIVALIFLILGTMLALLRYVLIHFYKVDTERLIPTTQIQ